MSEIKAATVACGKHEFQFVPPDQVRFVFRGDFEESDADAYFDFIFKHADQCNKRLYSAYDLSAFKRASEGGRKRVINVGRPYPYAALAIVGANFSTRAVAGMILRAGRLVAPKTFNFPYKFVASMDDADAWFDELRNRKSRI